MFRGLFTRTPPAKRSSGAAKSAAGPQGTPVDNKEGFPRRFRRVRPTGGRNADVAKVIISPKDPPVDCRVVDYSPGGACLEVWGQVNLPGRFELVFGATRKRCRVVWRAGRRMGVAF
jgi:PilZ domain-containing protein